MTTATSRKQTGHRRERLLDAAIELFRDRGYHATGIDDIGAAAGITGPGVYRHYRSKQELLVALFDRTAAGRIEAATRLAPAGADPRRALGALVDNHVTFAIADRSVIVVYLQELSSLEPADAKRIRRSQRRYLEVWVELLRQLHPQMSPEEALSTVHAAIGVIHSVAFHNGRLDRNRLHAILRRAALAVLRVPGSSGPHEERVPST